MHFDEERAERYAQHDQAFSGAKQNHFIYVIFHHTPTFSVIVASSLFQYMKERKNVVRNVKGNREWRLLFFSFFFFNWIRGVYFAFWSEFYYWVVINTINYFTAFLAQFWHGSRLWVANYHLHMDSLFFIY